MDPLSSLAVLAVAHGAALLSPGPDFVLVTRGTLRHGARHGMALSMGIVLANGVYITLALAGISLLQRHPSWAAALRWGGVAYLAVTGWHLLRAVSRSDATTPATAAYPQAMLGGVLHGLAAAMLNPKNAVFYLGLLAGVVDAATPTCWRWAFGAWMATAVLAWHLALVAGCRHPGIATALQRRLSLVDRLAGAALLGLAALLAIG
ncbi:LysE family translocator [Chitiniphilus purpureus]|uniref:LysE family translocator n=1 Tax=Chitiniphilus purpureus TaxID=2981137 RepID=A0ABY6DIL6_9NEIS|nr:LysE family translocator [Chitiniphilus sp. CD1]UXY14190.1 LysE family translocator [Chitiniphilus sp. CD1]